MAAEASGDADALREASQNGLQRTSVPPMAGPLHLGNLAKAHLAAGDLPAARQRADEAIAAAAELGMKHPLMDAFLTSARAAAAAGDAGRAHDDAH